MPRIRTATEIILGMIDFYRSAKPDLDTKPGTSARDICVDGFATQLARGYEELGAISGLQSIRTAIGNDLDKLGRNYGAVRKPGSKSTGPALLVFSDLAADIDINQGDIITAKNGATFTALSSQTVSPVFESTYKAVASTYRSDLDFVGLTEEYAVEVLVEAASTGIQGNISKYSLTTAQISGITGVTNASPFGGGSDPESDAAFKSRIFAIFSGSNTGTALGYRTAALSDTSVVDAIVIEPGDDLMTRDGTIVSVAEDGTRTITSEGSGGKVDVLIFGSRIQEVTDSYVYRDLSNTDDPTHSDNDYTLGQISADVNKTVSKKRIDNIAAEILPSQPVNNVVSVSGSLSGSNFVEKTVDSLGVISGNYEIVKDTGAYAGSPWGFDKLSWISSVIYNYREDKTKQTFNSQDSLAFTDVTEIRSATQNITVTNENSTVSATNRSSIQLKHYPVTNVTRVFNVTTGERYVVSSQNPDGSGSTNETGRITITGQSLPAVSDTLQVDYTWVYSYDPYFDFDNQVFSDNPRSVGDSVDWGYSNAVRRERVTLTASGSVLEATVTHPISTVISANVFTEESGTVITSSGELAVVVSDTISNVVSVVRDSDGARLWNTSDVDGTFSGTTIFLPTDTLAVFGDEVTVVYNAVDVFNATTEGNFSSNVITIVPSSDAVAGELVECNYIADVRTLLPSTLLPALPAIRDGNTFDTSTSSNIGSQPTTHVYSGSGVVSSNLRQAPSVLGLTIAGSISSGIITVTGTSLSFVQDAVITASVDGLEQDLSTAIKSHLGLTSAESVPSTVRVIRVTKAEAVTTNANLDVLSSDFTYDVRGYKIFDNTFVKNEAIIDSTLSTTEFTLPATPDNNDNIPSVGDRLRVSFYIMTSSDTEDVSFSKSGTQYTQKSFLLVDTIAKSSGFTSGSSSSATLTVTNLNQPVANARYQAYYDYLAPKTNERITVTYNYDRLVTDVTFEIEDVRPINADVLVKAATPVLVDVTMNIVVTTAFTNNSEIVRQNVRDVVTDALNAQELGTIIDSSDLINAAYTVSGVDRARIMYFNENGETGSVLSIEAQKNEYLVANTVTITVETR